MTVHSVPFWVDVDDYRTFTFEPRTACGKKLHNRANVRLPTTVVLNSVTCATCRRLLAMTADQYRAHLLAEKKHLDDVRAGQRDRAAAKRAAVLAERRAFVDQCRDDAQVALDAYLSDAQYPLMDKVLAAAMTLYQLNNPASRGDRLWVFTTEGVTKLMPGGSSARCVTCRFCRVDIGAGVLGSDYSRSYFDVREGVELAHNKWVAATPTNVVSVARHTTLCALAYLAGTTCVEPVPF